MSIGTERAAGEASSRAVRVLMLCYHYPPMSTTGSLRAARFVKYMPPGVEMEVLTVADPPEPCENVALAAEIAGRAVVHRAPLVSWVSLSKAERALGRPGAGALARLLAKAGKTLLTWIVWIPDSSVAWHPRAARSASRLLAERRFDVLYSTSPPHSAHLLAAYLARRHGLPLVVDFRDPWSKNPQRRWPTALHRAFEARLERAVLRRASAVLVNTPGNRGRLLEFAPGLDPAVVHVLPNGFDPARRAAYTVHTDGVQGRAAGAPLRLLYTGHFYDGSENGLLALARLMDRRPDLARGVRLRLIGSLDLGVRRHAERLVRAGLLELFDPVPADRVPGELGQADALLYVVPPHGKSWVPSKLYDYLLAEKPIVGILPRGDAWDILQSSGLGLLLEDTGDVEALADGLADGLERLVQNEVRVVPDRAAIARYDGRELTLRFAEILRKVAAESPAPRSSERARDDPSHEQPSGRQERGPG